MEYTFFWVSAAAASLALIATAIFKGMNPAVRIIGFISVAYSIVFEIIFGERLGLYYYIAPEDSTLYMLLGAVFIYTPLNIIYAVFLPENFKKILIYTAIWTAIMLLFEYASLLTRTIVLTGWKPIPWSIMTYAVMYLWIILYYRYLVRSPRRNSSSR